MLKPWHKADIVDALVARGWAGPAELHIPKDWYHVGEACTFVRAAHTLTLYFVADLGTGFLGLGSVESVTAKLEGVENRAVRMGN